MSEIRQLRGSAQIQREASEWVARLNACDVSDEDRARFDAWRRVHPRHARAYDEVSATWQQLSDAGHLVRAVALGQALDASAREAVRESVNASRRRTLFALAATLAAVAVGAGWWINALTPRTLFQTAIGEHAAVELPDGSSLELNSNSRARVDYDESVRVIRLERGEAYFDVQHDVSRPFWVVAGDTWVRAVGTAFNVDLRADGVRVTVSEGTVKVAANAPVDPPTDAALAQVSVSVLKAGQEVRVNRAGSDLRSLEPVELTRSASWRQGTLYFPDDRLADVVSELGRYTTLRIVIADDELRDLRVGGTFQANAHGAEALLRTLEDGFGLTIRRDEGAAYIAEAN